MYAQDVRFRTVSVKKSAFLYIEHVLTRMVTAAALIHDSRLGGLMHTMALSHLINRWPRTPDIHRISISNFMT